MNEDLYSLLMQLTKGNGGNTGDIVRQIAQMTGIDPNNHNAGFQIARYLLPTLFPSLLRQQLYANSLQPLQQNATNQALTLLSNPDAAANQYQAKVQANSGSTLTQVLQRLRSQGAGIGAEQGAGVNSQNQANTASNQFRAQQDSPEGIASRNNAILQIIASAFPNFGPLMNLNSITQGTPRGNSGIGGFLDSIQKVGNIAGLGGGAAAAVNPFAALAAPTVAGAFGQNVPHF